MSRDFDNCEDDNFYSDPYMHYTDDEIREMLEKWKKYKQVKPIIDEHFDMLKDVFYRYGETLRRLEDDKFTMDDFRQGLMLAGKIPPANEQEELEKAALDEHERGYDAMCFHGCPICGGRCNCDGDPCGHCEE